MKKRKLNLDQLEVTSFVTAVDDNTCMKAAGGLAPNDGEEAAPLDPEWILGTRGGCTHWENMCNDTHGPACA
ncbi:MAG: pinensin family lanthipeptide [Cyclobacteriaceae bacterium]